MVLDRPPAAFGGSPPREGETRAKRARGSLTHHLGLHSNATARLNNSFERLTTAQRQGKVYRRAAFRKVDALQTLVRAVKLFEPCACRRQAQSSRTTFTFCTAKSGPRIRNLQQQ